VCYGSHVCTEFKLIKLILIAGVITDKNVLPVTRLNFGRTQLETSSGVHTLGRLVCTGLVTLTGLPKSCQDLWLIGHTLNGFYSVMGSAKMESVYCDFTKLPDEAGKCFKFSRIIQLQLSNSIIVEKVSRNGLDMSTLNRRLSISTSREILILKQLELRLNTIWRG
jgi:hypothetical protein